MSRLIRIGVRGPVTGPDPSEVALRLVKDGVGGQSIAGVTLIPDGPTSAFLNGLPELDASTYGFSYTSLGVHQSVHYSPGFYSWRFTALRIAAQTNATISLRLHKGGVDDSGALAPLAAATGDSDPDWIASGWSDDDQDQGLAWTSVGFFPTLDWEGSGDALISTPSIAFTGRALRLSMTLARVAQASAIVTRRNSMSDRDNGTALATLALDGVHAAGSTTLTLRAPDSGPLVGRLPKSLEMTIGVTTHTASEDVTTAEKTSRILVSVTPGLAAEGADGTAVALAPAVTYSHPKVNLRRASSNEVERHGAFGREVSNFAQIPGHLMPAFIEVGDRISYSYTGGRALVNQRVEAAPDTEWGQEVLT